MAETSTNIVMTESAIAEVKRLITQTDFDSNTAGVRVGVKGGGCSGFTYTLNFDAAPAKDDEIFNFDGVR